MPLYEIYLLTLASFSHASSPSDTLRTIPFNQYDAKACIRRQSLLGRYRLDPNTGAPLNPMGRTGLLGKGLLPRWGPNHVIVIVVTRWMRDPKNGSPIQRTNRNVLQFVALERSKRYCIPWTYALSSDFLRACQWRDLSWYNRVLFINVARVTRPKFADEALGYRIFIWVNGLTSTLILPEMICQRLKFSRKVRFRCTATVGPKYDVHVDAIHEKSSNVSGEDRLTFRSPCRKHRQSWDSYLQKTLIKTRS
ncbi:unnamed protein product [Protopolystoma xenopodis]|uniref:ADP-ribose pyrophosphatase, mitochondrial n=1 Tax=Protopolystoma xenopodis TaxID=117903 RepID=A0A3S4ZWI0_9PLAT|nr:unnamed protein product [Protopolystoma xenopodis]